MDTFFQEILGGAGRLQENVGVTLFLKVQKKNQHKDKLQACNFKNRVKKVCICVVMGECECENRRL